MASNSEAGHANNVATCTDLFNICKGYGSRYNPAQKELELAQLEPQIKEAERNQSVLNKTSPAYTTAVASKDKAFAPLDSLVTRALGMFTISKALPGQKRSAQTLAKSIKGEGGKKSSAKEAAAEAASNDRSNSRRSMDSRVENFYRLIDVFTESGVYAANEPDLTLASLTAYANELKDLSEAVVIAEQPENNARQQRNTALYNPQTGLVDKGYAVKRYIRSAFGTKSPEYQLVRHIRFSRPNKK